MTYHEKRRDYYYSKGVRYDIHERLKNYNPTVENRIIKERIMSLAKQCDVEDFDDIDVLLSIIQEEDEIEGKENADVYHNGYRDGLSQKAQEEKKEEDGQDGQEKSFRG